MVIENNLCVLSIFDLNLSGVAEARVVLTNTFGPFYYFLGLKMSQDSSLNVLKVMQGNIKTWLTSTFLMAKKP